MSPQTSIRRKSRLKMIAGVSFTALLGLGAAVLPNGAERGALAATPSVLLPPLPTFPLPLPLPFPVPAKPSSTVTPIKHVIYVVAENRSFDNIYATYQPKNGQKIWNLLSQGIVNADGTPGKNFAKGQQFQATSSNGVFALSPVTKAPYATMPVPTLNSAQALGIGLELNAELAPGHVVFVNPNGTPGPVFPNGDPDLPLKDQITLTTGGFAQAPSPITSTKASGPDIRIPGVTTNTLPAGPFQQTSAELPYDAYAGDTIHQLFQMWQMNDCSMHHATFENPTGCLHDLYPFVAVTNGTAPGSTPGDGGQDMAFFNMTTGDAPIFKALADQYAISDNFHQAIMGGSVTGHFGIAYGDNPFFANPDGTPGTPTGGITNPNPQVGTINTYVSNGTWVNCGDSTQPGVAPIQSYLASLPYRVGPNCAANSFYPIRDANPGFTVTGAPEPASAGTMPPITVRHIGDELNANNISWAFYSGGYNSAVAVANGATDIVDAVLSTGYCAICNPFQYSLSTMSDPNQRAAHLKDVVGDLYPAIASGSLPAVSFVKMDGALQGHPGSGKVSLLEEFVQDMVNRVQANPALFAETAIIVTFDESGGLYDSGFIQPLDFFGDGPRIPLLVISPYSTGGRVSHSYTDQVSVLKFIERNWRLNKISNRSRDNLPNPIQIEALNPWVPLNMPAIGDLFDMFDFPLGEGGL
jgi:phospholipase C